MKLPEQSRVPGFKVGGVPIVPIGVPFLSNQFFGDPVRQPQPKEGTAIETTGSVQCKASGLKSFRWLELGLNTR